MVNFVNKVITKQWYAFCQGRGDSLKIIGSLKTSESDLYKVLCFY